MLFENFPRDALPPVKHSIGESSLGHVRDKGKVDEGGEGDSGKVEGGGGVGVVLTLSELYPNVEITLRDGCTDSMASTTAEALKVKLEQIGTAGLKMVGCQEILKFFKDLEREGVGTGAIR